MGGGLRPGGCVSCAPGWTVAARTEAPRAVPVGPPRHQRSAQVARAGGDAAAGGAGDGAARWAPGRSGNAAQRPLSARRRGVGAARRRERGGERGPRGRPPTVFSHGPFTLKRDRASGTFHHFSLNRTDSIAENCNKETSLNLRRAVGTGLQGAGGLQRRRLQSPPHPRACEPPLRS